MYDRKALAQLYSLIQLFMGANIHRYTIYNMAVHIAYAWAAYPNVRVLFYTVCVMCVYCIFTINGVYVFIHILLCTQIYMITITNIV